MKTLISRRSLLCSAGLLIPAAKLFGWQDKDADPKYSSSVRVVHLLVTVRDKQGKIDNSLNQEDFTLEEDGHPQVIKYFAKQTGAPLALGLLVDTSLRERREIEPERRASRIFSTRYCAKTRTRRS